MSFRFFPLEIDEVNRRKVAWEGLANKQPFGRAAIYLLDDPPDSEEIGRDIAPAGEIPLVGPAGRCPEWDNYIREQLRSLHMAARSRYLDDSFPAIFIPRSVHGQSQALAEAFGCRLIPQGDDLYFPEPWIESAPDIDHLKVKPIERCLYGRAIEFAKYAREVTDGQLRIRNPVMTGPIDTANYVLGTMRLMEWIYEEPKALHKLLQIITDVLIDTIGALQKAVDGQLCPDHGRCLPRGFALCSEARSLISAEVYNDFEAPYLRQIGESCGPYMVHSCGTWERTLHSLLQDPNVMMINFQCREMDLSKVYELTEGRLSLDVGRSVDLSEKYIWPDAESFFRYVMSNLPGPAPLTMGIHREDIDAYLSVQSELEGGTSGIFRWRPK